jgi:hypothetical protein
MASGQAREEGGDVQQACDFDWHCALSLVAGAPTQNEHNVQLGVGDIELMDGARPSTRLSKSGSQWLSIYLPPAVAHLPSWIRAAGLLVRARWNACSAGSLSARF